MRDDILGYWPLFRGREHDGGHEEHSFCEKLLPVWWQLFVSFASLPAARLLGILMVHAQTIMPLRSGWVRKGLLNMDKTLSCRKQTEINI